MSTLRGLEDSYHPCAAVLSVAGLLDHIGLFPAGEWFIPEVRKARFLRAEPFTVDVPFITAHRVSNMAVMTMRRLAVYTVYRVGYTYWVWEGVHIPGGKGGEGI